MSKVLEVRNLTYTYSKGTPFEKVALKDVSVGFEKGRITGLIGHTGSGKSTLVQLFNGLYRATSGDVLLNGENIWAKPKDIAKVRFKVGLVMQYPEYQLFDETVVRDIGFGPRNLGLSDEEIDIRVREAASFTGITDDMLEKSPFELSGGQKRRVAIAGVIAMQPEVLILDEPAAGLDPRGRREILSGLRKYAKEKETSVILVSHSMEDMAYYCDDVVVMNKGEVYKVGTVDEIFFCADELRSVGLNVPSVSIIASILRNKGIELEGKLFTVEGVYKSIKKYIGGEVK